jgi:hypothetical protein
MAPNLWADANNLKILLKDEHSSLLRPSVSDQEEEKCLIHQHQVQQKVSVVP